jgi:hypothetical protein
MERENIFDRPYFEDDRFFDDEIGSIGAIKTNSFINQWQFDLPSKSQIGERQFKPKTILINVLQKPRTNDSMHLDRQANHAIGHPFDIPPVLFVSLAHFVIFVMHGTSPRHEPPHHPPKR